MEKALVENKCVRCLTVAQNSELEDFEDISNLLEVQNCKPANFDGKSIGFRDASNLTKVRIGKLASSNDELVDSNENQTPKFNQPT